jgi:hypothetical protein
MKYFPLILALMLVGCKEKPITDNVKTSLIGKWNHYQSKSGNGGSGIYTTNSLKGYSLEFYKDKKFLQTENKVKFQGNFEVKKGRLYLTFLPQDSTIIYNFELTPKTLTLNPVDEDGSFICDEGCTDVFRREN